MLLEQLVEMCKKNKIQYTDFFIAEAESQFEQS